MDRANFWRIHGIQSNLEDFPVPVLPGRLCEPLLHAGEAKHNAAITQRKTGAANWHGFTGICAGNV
jgi:hypothetical protein